MSNSRPSPASPPTVADPRSEKFEKLASAWERETRYLSSLTQIVLNPHYQQIIGMGDKAVPFIFDRLSTSPGHWFWALSAITGADPVAPEDAGNVERMTEAWLKWGRLHGYVS